MRMMMIVLAAVLLASPLAAQTNGSAPPADAWRSMPIPDPRLHADFADARVPHDAAEMRSRLPLHTWGLLGAGVGCLVGAVLMGSTAQEGEVAVMRFNGCIAGGAVGGFLGGIVGLARGA